VNGVEFAVGRTREPWLLPIDALVISAGQGGGIGSLGDDVRYQFPDAAWEKLNFQALRPDTPQVVEISTFRQLRTLERPGPSPRLRNLIVVTVRDWLPAQKQESPATADGVARAVAAAVRLAQQTGVRSLGIPLIGTGSAGLPEPLVAEQIVSQALSAAELLREGELAGITFICLERSREATIRRAWSEYPNGPGHVPQPPASGTSGGLRFRPAARELLGWAGTLARSRGATEATGVDVVLAAVLQPDVTVLDRHQLMDGATASLLRSLPEPSKAGERVRAALAAIGVNPQPFASGPPFRDDEPLLFSLVIAAQDLARQLGADELAAHHVVAAALVGWPLPDAVEESLGRTRGELVGTLRSAIAERWPREAADRWDKILSSELVSDFRSDHVPTGRFRSKASNTPPLVDHLGVDVYVSMLASLIAREATPMPVSIGLFGEWGSGKSYFMELVRQRVQELSKVSGPYHREILQMTFNAWHYADTNLWASLATEFFDQLTKEEVDPLEARRDAIQAKRKETQQIRQEMEATRTEAETRVTELRVQLKQAAADREKQRRDLDGALLKRTAKELGTDPVFLSTTERLGLRGDPEQVLRIARDTLAIRDDLVATRRILGGGRQILLPFALFVLGLTAFSAALLFPDWTRWFRGGAARRSRWR
jgi:O-acetyl-ADP-ribose deacetylase (regulator of RNase III)